MGDEDTDEGARKPDAPLAAEPGSGAPPAKQTGRNNYRLVIALVWVALQAILVFTADRRVDGAFGFRMFNESSSIKLALYREVDGPDGRRARVHVDGGVWTARASDGSSRRSTWYDRVPMPYWIFDQEMHASYGAATQLSRLRGALDDLARHLPVSDDAETRRFLLDVSVRRNGREPVIHHLVSQERDLPVSRSLVDGGP